MRLQETIAFYLLVGLGVAAAMLLNTRRRTMLESLLQELAAMLFWPMYLPLLLSQPAAKTAPTETPISPRDEMAMAIARVNSELDSALSSLDGWAESVLISERSRLVESGRRWLPTRLESGRWICSLQKMMHLASGRAASSKNPSGTIGRMLLPAKPSNRPAAAKRANWLWFKILPAWLRFAGSRTTI